MEGRFSTKYHNGRPIVLLDYSQVAFENELAMLADKGFQFAIEGEQKNNNLLVLIDLTGSKVSGKGLNELKRTYAQFKPYIKRKAVIVTVYGSLRFANLVNFLRQSPTRLFLNKEEALSYLAR